MAGDQPTLFGSEGAPAPSLPAATPAARAGDPDTSQKAARANPVQRSTLRHRVLWELYQVPGGMTDFAIAQRLGLSHLRGSVAKRRQELTAQRLGVSEALVRERTDERGHTITASTDTGSPAIVWRITEAGRRLIAELGPPEQEPF